MPLTVLPDELLDIALRALLPPFTSESLTDTYVFTVPSDLLNVRLVSRRFHRLATPIAWRRAHLSLAKPSTSNSNTTKTDSKGKCTRAATDHPLRSLRRCQFLSEHPHLASHIRILILDLSEWHYSNNTSHARAALRAATASMTSLRTVLVWDADVLSVPDIQELLQKPMLRAVCLMDLNGAVFPAESKGLRMLHVANTVCPARLIRGAKETLECVSIEVARTRDVCEGGTAVDGKEATLKEMPWRTLKEVALVDCMDEREWVAFLEGFQIHKSLSLPTSLNELLIGHADGLELTRIHSLLKTFSSHPITRLTLFHLPLLDPALLTSICSSFPMLTHLTLLTESLLVAWPHPLDAYTRPLSTLKNLTVLSWNNFPLEQEHATNCFMNMCEDSLAKLYTRQVKAVVKRCKSVKQVRFVSMGEWVVDTCMVRKKGCARCGGCHGVAEGGDVPVLDFKGCKGTFGDWMRSEELGPVEVVRTTQTALHTRSWGTGSGVFEDI